MTINGVSTNNNVHLNTTTPMDSSSGSSGESFALLPAPSSINIDPGQALALFAIEEGFARRKSARASRANAAQAIEAAQQTELTKMNEAADARYTAAATDAWVQIGTGAVTLGSMGASFAGTELRNASLAKAGATTFEVMKNGGGDLTKGVGGFVSAGQRHDADRSDASAKAASFASKALENIVDDAKDDERGGKEVIRKALDFLREYQSAQAQSRSAALYKV